MNRILTSSIQQTLKSSRLHLSTSQIDSFATSSIYLRKKRIATKTSIKSKNQNQMDSSMGKALFLKLLSTPEFKDKWIEKHQEKIKSDKLSDAQVRACVERSLQIFKTSTFSDLKKDCSSFLIQI